MIRLQANIVYGDMDGGRVDQSLSQTSAPLRRTSLYHLPIARTAESSACSLHRTARSLPWVCHRSLHLHHPGVPSELAKGRLSQAARQMVRTRREQGPVAAGLSMTSVLSLSAVPVAARRMGWTTLPQTELARREVGSWGQDC